MATLKIKNSEGKWEVAETPGAVKFTPQTLTSAEQVQARANLGIADYLFDIFVIKDTVYWDGDKEGKTVVDSSGDGSYGWCHISDIAPSLEDLVNVTTVEMTMSNGTI